MFDFDGKTWDRTVVDPAIAAQDLRGGDLDGDGTPDVVAVGRQDPQRRLVQNEPGPKPKTMSKALENRVREKDVLPKKIRNRQKPPDPVQGGNEGGKDRR